MQRFHLNWILRQQFWIYMLLAYPILDYFFRNILPIPLVSSIWDDGLLILLLLFVIFGKNPIHRPFSSINKPFTAFFVLGIAYLVVDMAQWNVTFEGFRSIFQYMLAFFMGYYLLTSQVEFKKYIQYIVGLAAIIGLYGIMQKFLGVQTPQSWIDASEDISFRAFSIVQSPNILGSYMIMIIPIATMLFFSEKDKKRKAIWAFSVMIMLGALYLTLSRGAWLSILAALAVMGALYNRKVLIVGLIVALLTLFFVPSVNQRFSQLFTPTYIEKSMKDGRIARWMGAYDKMRFEPFFGSGLGHYGGAVAKRNLGTTYVDSYYFKTLAETGIVGLGVFFWLLSSLLKNLYLSWKRTMNRTDYLLMGGIFTGLLAVIFHNAVENIFEMPFMTTFFWFIAGMALSLPFLESFKGEKKAHD